MSREINLLMLSLEQLRQHLEQSWDKTLESGSLAAELSGEWEQDLANDLDELSIKIRDLIDELEGTIEEGKTLIEEWEKEEETLRDSGDDEEFNKKDAEHIQEKMREERERRRR